jgi:hypothetical protein
VPTPIPLTFSSVGNRAVKVKSVAATIYAYNIVNPNSYPIYVKFYNKIPDNVVSTDTPAQTVLVPADDIANDPDVTYVFSTAISVRCVTGALNADTNAPAVSPIIDLELAASSGGSGPSTAPVANTIYVDTVNGDNSTGLRGRSDKPFLTIVAAVVATGITSGDVILLRAGTHALGNSTVEIPSGVSLIGSGRGTTTITSTLASSSSVAIKITSCPQMSDFTFNSLAAASDFHLSVGNVSNGASIYLLIERVNVTNTPSDFLSFFGASQTGTVTVRNCDIRGRYDSIAVGDPDPGSGLAVIINDSDFLADGTGGQGDLISRVINCRGSVVTASNCRFTALAGIANVIRPVEVGPSSILTNCIFSTAGTIDLRVYNSGTVTLCGGRGSGTNGLITTTGTVAYKANDLVANNNLADLANASTARVNLGVTVRQTFSNANVTVTAGTTVLAQIGTMSTSKTITFPAASSYANGTGFRVIDESGTVARWASPKLTCSRAGSDTINGATSFTINWPYASVYFVSDGASKWTTDAVSANIAAIIPPDPTGTTSTTDVMAGLASGSTIITPRTSGAVLVIISGSMANSNATLAGCTAQIRYGSGTGPANGAAVTGTAAGSKVRGDSAAANQQVGFCASAILTGMTIGTGYWIDLTEAAVTAGTGSLTNVSMNVVEL